MNALDMMPTNLEDVPHQQIGSLLVRAINNPSGEPNISQIWLYYPMPRFVLGTLEVIDSLIAKDWCEVPAYHQTLLNTQIHEILCVRTMSGEWQIWTPKESADYVKHYPVALIAEMNFDEQLIRDATLAIGDMPTLPMLTPLPLASSGEGGFILDPHNQDAKLAGYRISSLPQEAQEHFIQSQKQLREMIHPGKWLMQTPLHRLAFNIGDYQSEMLNLTTREQLTYGATRKKVRQQIVDLQQAMSELRFVMDMQDRPSYASDMKEIARFMQTLARDYFEYHQSLQKKPLASLPDLSTSHQTILPSVEHMRGLAQSFGPRVARSLWNTEENTEQLLQAPNGAKLAVRGENGHEQKALHQFIEGGMGVEGIKYMTAMLAIYHEQTGAPDRKTDARVTLRQILQFMGRGNHIDDLDEQRKLMHYILYLSRTWITALDKIYDQSHRRGRPRKGYLEYSPLIVLEALGSDVRGGIRIPDVVEFHLGKEYWEQMFGNLQHFFTLPTRLLLSYHSKDQSHEICLAFYLANMINLNFGTYEIHFPKMLIQAGLQHQEDIDKGHDRTRNALRVLYAIERLEMDLLIIREPHPDIDIALAVDYYNGKTAKVLDGKELSLLAEATRTRIENAYRHFQILSPAERQTKQRIALQSLLERVVYSTIKFKSGPLINTQIQRRKQQRQIAIESREKALEAQRKRSKKRQKP